MRKLIVFNLMSLDGYVAGPGGDVMVLPLDASFDAYCAQRLVSAGTLLLGRTTYDMFRGFWPPVFNDEAASPDQREISRRDNEIDKRVVSDGLTAEETDPWRDTTRIIRRADAHERITELKAQPGRDILVFGSLTLWKDLFAHGLVDELHLMVGAVVVGDGSPAFTKSPDAALRLIDVRQADGSHNVLLRYAVSYK